MTEAPAPRRPSIREFPDRAQVERVQATWGRLAGRSEAVGARFYDRLFTVAPQTRELFSEQIAYQTVKFIRMLDLIVVALNHREELDQAIAGLGARHRQYAVVPAHYEAAEVCLLGALDDVLGDGFAEADREAWQLAYGYLRDGMLDAPGAQAGLAP